MVADGLLLWEVLGARLSSEVVAEVEDVLLSLAEAEDVRLLLVAVLDDRLLWEAELEEELVFDLLRGIRHRGLSCLRYRDRDRYLPWLQTLRYL